MRGPALIDAAGDKMLISTITVAAAHFCPPTLFEMQIALKHRPG